MPAQAQHWIRTAFLSGATGPVAVGTALVSNGTRYVVATAANRASYGRAECLSISSGDDDDTAIEGQWAGVVPNSITGLGAGSASWVRVTSSGGIERCSPTAGDDLLGRCNPRGDLFLQPGVWDSNNYAGGGGGAVGGSDGELQYNNTGTLDGLPGVTVPSVGSGLQLANGYFIWSRDSFDALSVSLIGLDTDDVIRIGSSLDIGYPGYDVEIDVGASQAISLLAQEMRLGANNLQIGPYSAALGSFGGAVGAVALLHAGSNPSSGVAGRILTYVDPADSVLKYVQPDGTVVSLDGSVAAPSGDAGDVVVLDGAGGFSSGGPPVELPGSLAAGDLLYVDGSSNLVRIPIGTEGQVLTVVSGLPAWADATGGGGDPGFDPTTLAWSGYWRADTTSGEYDGAPWAPTASAGTSGSNGNLVAGVAPATGTAVNGYTPADGNGSTHYLETAGTTFVDVAAYTIDVLVYVRSSAASAAQPYNNECLVCDNSGTLGIAVRDNGGTQEIIGFHYRGAYDVVVADAGDGWTLNAWHRVRLTLSGGTLSLRIDGNTPVTTAAGGNLSAFSEPLRLLTNFDVSTFADAMVLEVGFALVAFSSTDFDNIDAYDATRYGI